MSQSRTRKMSCFFGLLAMLCIATQSPHAQSWSLTNGPYAESANGFVVERNDLVLVNARVGLLECDVHSRTARLARKGVSAEEVITLNDGTYPTCRAQNVLLDSAGTGVILVASKTITAATPTSIGSRLAATPGVGILRRRIGMLLLDTVAREFESTYISWMRAATSGAIYLATDGGQLFVSHDDGSTWLPRGTALGSIQAFAIAPTGDLWISTASAVLHSTDEGATFSPITLPPSTGIVRGIAAKSHVVMCVTSAHGILRSEDDGTHWYTDNSGLDSLDVSAVGFLLHSDSAIATCYRTGLFVRASNGGWSNVPSHQRASDISAFSKPSESRLYALSPRYGVFRTENSGDDWLKCWDPMGDTITAIASHGDNLLIGTRHLLLHSSDAGRSFDTVTWTGKPSVAQLIVDTSGRFYGIGSSARSDQQPAVFRSEDGGHSWSRLAMIDSLYTFSIATDSNGLLLAFLARRFLGTFEPEIVTSSDAGNTWKGTTTPYFVQNWYSAAVAPDGCAYIATQYGLYRSEPYNYDAWRELEEYSNVTLHDKLQFVTGDDYFGFLGNTLEHTTDHGATWTPIPQSYAGKSVGIAFHNTLFMGRSGVERFDPRAGVSAQGSSSALDVRVLYSRDRAYLKITTPDIEALRVEVVAVTGQRVSTLLENRTSTPVTLLPIPRLPACGRYLICTTTSHSRIATPYTQLR